MRSAQFNRALEHPVKSEENRNLKKHGKATSEWADFVLLHELHQLLVHLLRIALVLFLERFHLRLQFLHPLHRAGAGLGERPKQQLDDDRDENDCGSVRWNERVEAVHRKQ